MKVLPEAQCIFTASIMYVYQKHNISLQKVGVGG